MLAVGTVTRHDKNQISDIPNILSEALSSQNLTKHVYNVILVMLNTWAS